MHGTLPVSLWSPALAVTNAHLEKGKGSFPTFPPFLGRTLVLLRLCANLWFLHFVCKNEILLSAQFVVQAHPHGQEEEGSAGQVSQIQGKESLWDQRGGKKKSLLSGWHQMEHWMSIYWESARCHAEIRAPHAPGSMDYHVGYTPDECEESQLVLDTMFLLLTKRYAQFW